MNGRAVNYSQGLMYLRPCLHLVSVFSGYNRDNVTLLKFEDKANFDTRLRIVPRKYAPLNAIKPLLR